MVLSDGDRYVGLVQLLALAGACGAIVGVARRLGLGRSAALFGALAFATFTVVALQTPTALNDLVVASLLVVCVYFALGSTRAELGLCATALALAVGTKGTVVFALPVLVVFVLASQPRSRWWSLAAAGAIGLAAGSFWFALNLVETGDLRGGVRFDPAQGAPARTHQAVVRGPPRAVERGGDRLSHIAVLGARRVRRRIRRGGIPRSPRAPASRRRRGARRRPCVLRCSAARDVGPRGRTGARARPLGRRARGQWPREPAPGGVPRVSDALLVRARVRRPVHRRRRARRGRRAAAATVRRGARRAPRRAERAPAHGACAGLRPPAHALCRLLRRARRDGVWSGTSREATGLDVDRPHSSDARRLGRVLRSTPGGSGAPLGEPPARAVDSLVRPGGERQR